MDGNIRLEPKSGIAFQTEATEVLYGGAAGGMKSFTLRVSAIRWSMEVPGIQVYFFRRTLPDLRDNHLRGPTSFFNMLAGLIQSGHVKYHAQENEFEFWNKAVLHLCYCDSENDVEKYRGAEIHVLMIDELTHFTDYQYRFLRSRVRKAGLKIPEKYQTRLPRIETASNPGSIGHAWVKRTWISPKPPFEIWRADKKEGGMLRQFIPAKLSDNPHLTKEDPMYEDRLRGLGSDNLVKAMLDGDWDLIAGQAFEKLTRKTHCLDPFDIPEDWLVFGSFDWGSTKPFSFGLWAVASNPITVGEIDVPRGALVRFNEWYGWNGKPDEGLRMEAGEVAQGILKRVKPFTMAYCVADSSMWKVDGGPSIAETFNNHKLVLRPSTKGPNSRNIGYIEVRQRIAGNEEGPMLFATSNCHDGFWRTLPDMVMDEARYGPKAEQIDTDQEDHCFALGTRTIFGVVGEDQIVMNQHGITEGVKTSVREADTVRLTFDDGDQIICTPDHKFCSITGWVEAKDLLDEVCYNVLCERRAEWLRSLVLSVRNFLGFAIIFADSISNEKALGCTAWSGNILTAISQTNGMSTTVTRTGRIISSKILSWFDRQITFHIMRNSMMSQDSYRSLKLKLKNGMHQKLEGNGILRGGRKIGLKCIKILLRKIARSVVRNIRLLGLSRTSHLFAVLLATKQTCVCVEPNGKVEITCLKVVKGNAFALEGGTLVHNCSDEVMYACMSRPWMRHIEKAQAVTERWLMIEDREEETWRTA